jgi:hypothetical protein
MRKVILLILVFFTTASVNAQLSNTKWKGVLNIQGGMDVLFNFSNDTLDVINSENESLETMKFSMKDSLITFVKLYGSSQCDTSTPGVYKFEVTGNEMTQSLVSDSCADRSEAIGTMKLNKE